MRLVRLLFDIFSEFKFLVINFLIIIIFIFSYFTYIKNTKIIDFLETRNKSFVEQYEITYENLRIISENTFYGIINKSVIYDSIKNGKNNQQDENYYRQKLYRRFAIKSNYY